MTQVQAQGLTLLTPEQRVNFAPESQERRYERVRPLRRIFVAVAYWIAVLIGRFVCLQTIRFHVVRRETIERSGPYVLALTHIGHLEPFLIGQMYRRRINWIARLEFFRNFAARWALNAFDTISVNRNGVPVSTVRRSVERLRDGKIIGIFPEGGVMTGDKFICRGGTMKLGACMISQRANVPIVPCVVLGTHHLNTPAPWIPFRFFPPRRTNIWVAFGNAIEPVSDRPSRKEARRIQGERMQDEFRRLYQELQQQYNLNDSAAP